MYCKEWNGPFSRISYERKKERIFISPPTRINSAIGLMALSKNGETGITKTRKLNKQIKQMDVPWRLSTR